MLEEEKLYKNFLREQRKQEAEEAKLEKLRKVEERKQAPIVRKV